MPPEGRLLVRVLEAMREVTGRDFTRYRPAPLWTALSRWLDRHPDPERIADGLRARPDEARALADDMLVAVTSFFREREVLDAIGRHALPAILDRKRPGEPLRAWCVGCATGEEAYSLAMVLLDGLDGRGGGVAQVFATDLHAGALATAREGVYGDDIAGIVGVERLARYFERVRGGYRAGARLRETVAFAIHDVTADAPYAQLDLIACCNVLAYFDRELQVRVGEVLCDALEPGGYLALGARETIAVPDLARAPHGPSLYVRDEVDGAATDEPLRSVLEELRRCKQELASVSMELDLVCEESRRRLEALHGAAKDTDDLLSETDVAVLVLDRALRILHFTPPALALFNLRAGDRGRPLDDLTHRLPELDLADVARACAGGAVLERELACVAGRRWLMRARSNPSARVVITFVDITAARREAT